MVSFIAFGLYIVACIIVLIAKIIVSPITIPVRIIKHARRVKIRKGICRGSFVYYKDFENHWLSMSGQGRYGNRDGFKYQDGSGCYVITIYRKPVKNNSWKTYENVYVGQSMNVYQRVHNHFNGKGNGDVYADIKCGKWVYVSFVRCEEYELNDMEIKLIFMFNATESYNKTRGGSAIR